MTTLAFLTLASITSSGVTPASLDVTPAAVTDSHAAYEAELLGDAAEHSSLLADGSTSGFIKGKFTLSDGNANTLNIGGFMQTRYLANFRDRPGSDDDFTHGFQAARARLRFTGSIWEKNFTYSIMTEMATTTGTATLLDAEARYTYDNKVYVRAGQFKPLFLREELVYDPLQLTIDRTVTNAVFTMTRSQGAGLGWAGEQVRVGADLHDGAKNLNTPFASSSEADYAITARADWMFAGDSFKRFDDMTSWKGSAFTGMLGSALDWESYGHTGGGATKQDIFGATVDLTLEGDGWNALVAGVYRNTSPNAGSDVSDWGMIAQAGFFVTDQLELFGRYDGVFPDTADGPDNFNTLTAGANYYLSPQSQAARLTGDVVWYLDAEADSAIIPAPSTIIDLLNDTEGNQYGVRLQLQVLF
jgi:hypothetical protein